MRDVRDFSREKQFKMFSETCLPKICRANNVDIPLTSFYGLTHLLHPGISLVGETIAFRAEF